MSIETLENKRRPMFIVLSTARSSTNLVKITETLLRYFHYFIHFSVQFFDQKASENSMADGPGFDHRPTHTEKQKHR